MNYWLVLTTALAPLALYANGSSSNGGQDGEDKEQVEIHKHYHHWSTPKSYPGWKKDRDWHPSHKRNKHSSDWSDDTSDRDDSSSDHSSSHSSKLPLPVGTDHYGQEPPKQMTWGTDEHGTWDNGVTVDEQEEHHHKKKSKWKAWRKHERDSSEHSFGEAPPPFKSKSYGSPGYKKGKYGSPDSERGYYGKEGYNPGSHGHNLKSQYRPFDHAEKIDPHISIDASDDRDDTITPIDLDKRARDFAAMFRGYLSLDPEAEAYAVVDGIRVNNIVDVQALPNNSLLMLTIRENKRERKMIVKAEDVEMLEQVMQRNTPIRYPSRW